LEKRDKKPEKLYIRKGGTANFEGIADEPDKKEQDNGNYY